MFRDQVMNEFSQFAKHIKCERKENKRRILVQGPSKLNLQSSESVLHLFRRKKSIVHEGFLVGTLLIV